MRRAIALAPAEPQCDAPGYWYVCVVFNLNPLDPDDANEASEVVFMKRGVAEKALAFVIVHLGGEPASDWARGTARDGRPWYLEEAA